MLRERAVRCTAIIGERLIVDQRQLNELEEISRRIGSNFDVVSARKAIVETIPRLQAELDARRLPVTANDLPPDVLAVSVSLGGAHMRYATLDELIEDLRTYFTSSERDGISISDNELGGFISLI